MTSPSTTGLSFGGPLAGLRVVDLTVEVGELAGRLLADLGADVVRVEPPGGSPARALPPFAPGGTGLWWLYRNSNKRGLTLDLDVETDRARLHGLLGGADVLLDSAPPGARDAQGLGASALTARYPRLVVCSLTWFGLEGPYASYTATDDVVLAISGWLAAAGLSNRDPLLCPGSIPSDAVGVMGALATLAALWQRRVTDRGQLLDLSAFEAVIQVDTWSVVNASAIANAGMDARRLRNAQDSLYPTIRTSDGWIRLVLLSPRQWRSLWEWMGSPEAFADPYWEQTFARFENRDVLHPMFEEFFAPMAMMDAAIEGQRRGIVITPILKPDDILADGHFASRETFVDAEIAPGLTVPVTAGFFQVDGTRAGYRAAAPSVGATDGGGWAAGAAPSDSDRAGEDAGPPAPAAGPLAGVRVVDFGHGGVGVQAGRMFAENGADVVKIETRSYPDFMRVIMGKEMTPSFASSSRSKRSFGVDLKRPEGLELAKRLVAMADVVIENNSTGTMADLGLGYETLAELNPGLVYVSSQLLGSRGTRAMWLGYGPSVQAYGGLTDLWSYADGGPVGGNSNHPDLLVGHLCAVAGLAGLLRRERTGEGAHCEVAQVEAVVATLGDLLLAEALAPRSVRPVGNDDERGAPWGVFRCAGDEDPLNENPGSEEWCVVCVRDDADWAALRTAMGDPEWAADARWSTPDGRRAGRDELAGRVGTWTATLTPAEVGAACQAAGVPGAPMQYASQLLTDPQLVARGFLVNVEQPDAGPLTFDGAAFRASDMAPPHIGPAPRLGEHTREICRDVLGLDPQEIERLVDGGVLEVAPETLP